VGHQGLDLQDYEKDRHPHQHRDGSWSDLKTGARVNVGYHTVGEDRVADWVVILR
jgi:hypothetical protein